jgi:hypothetical protein
MHAHEVDFTLQGEEELFRATQSSTVDLYRVTAELLGKRYVEALEVQLKRQGVDLESETK